MEKQFYQGYPPWRKSNYQPQTEIIIKIMGGEDKAQADYEPLGPCARIQFMINLLTSNQSLNALQQLAIMTKVRQELSNQENLPDISRVLQETQIIQIVSQLFKTPDNLHELIRYLKLEGAWILTNIAYGKEEDIMAVLDEKYEILNDINRFLQSDDLPMIDQIIWFIGNACGESLRLRNMIISRTYIIDSISQLVAQLEKSNKPIRKGLLNNLIWCLRNVIKANQASENSLATESVDTITPEEKTKLLFIIKTFISGVDAKINNHDALECLVHLLKGDDEQIIN
mmetsp:Transcript_2123/g.3746  ORF Transcript_2123/g.3746 Transcript_2123/m.3746 type:complete len:285 (-) Transcript_2123:984-1838(-)